MSGLLSLRVVERVMERLSLEGARILLYQVRALRAEATRHSPTAGVAS
jgi:hypothetical protein